jgi:hypothetical protein
MLLQGAARVKASAVVVCSSLLRDGGARSATGETCGGMDMRWDALAVSTWASSSTLRVGYVGSDSEDGRVMANKRRNTDRVGIKAVPSTREPPRI